MKRLLLLLLLLVPGSAPAQEARTNLVVLAIDTLRADHLGTYGYERPTSPVIDGLAGQGLTFERAYATAPWTLPSFASMFTGRYPTRHGAGLEGPLRNLADQMPRSLPPTIPTLASALRDAGYRTGAVVSNPYLLLGVQNGYQDFTCRTVDANRIGALARQWLADRGDSPFHLLVHFNDPHEPTDPPDPMLEVLGVGEAVIEDPLREGLERWGREREGSFLGRKQNRAAVQPLLRTKRALYDASIREVDQEIGRIVAQLRHQGLLEKTLLVIVSDHGEEFWDHGEFSRDAGEDPRHVWGIGHGHTFFDELMRVPLIVRGPGIPRGLRVEEQFGLVDLMPTLLGWLGIAPPDGMDGEDRRGWLRLRERPALPVGFEAIAYGRDRIGWSDGVTKLITDRTGDPQAWFDLRLDPEELEPRALGAADSSVVQLHETLLRWSDAMVADAPPPVALQDLTPEMREGLRSLGYVE